MYPQRSVMTCGLATALEPPHFNHAPVWGATACATRSTSCPASFNPRTRVGCDVLVSRGDYGIHQRFNPRTRVGCDLVVFVTILLASTVFQSTHPRGVRPFVSVRCRVCYEVSIHAPAWGATYLDNPSFAAYRVSIHAPAWGATGGLLGMLQGKDKFQSTHPRGVRLGDTVRDCCCKMVSIHAPAWGATSCPNSLIRAMKSFNPRTRVGCDGNGRAPVSRGRGFQSTHPRGVRHEIKLGIPRKELVSIHAPAWGATRTICGVWALMTGFNPRTRVGCDPPNTSRTLCLMRFQSTHPRGVRRDPFVKDFTGRSWFQSTHPRGVRRFVASKFKDTSFLFQSTHPRGVRLMGGRHLP